MKENTRNPVIRVYPHTRKQLKVIAAQLGETMQETVARLAQAEIERLQKGEAHAQSLQVPDISKQGRI